MLTASEYVYKIYYNIDISIYVFVYNTNILEKVFDRLKTKFNKNCDFISEYE